MTKIQGEIIDLTVQIYFSSGLSVTEALDKAKFHFFCRSILAAAKLTEGGK